MSEENFDLAYENFIVDMTTTGGLNLTHFTDELDDSATNQLANILAENIGLEQEINDAIQQLNEREDRPNTVNIVRMVTEGHQGEDIGQIELLIGDILYIQSRNWLHADLSTRVRSIQTSIAIAARISNPVTELPPQ